MTKEQKYKAFVDAMIAIAQQGYNIEIAAEFDTVVIAVFNEQTEHVCHHHCIDDNSFPIGTTNWLNNLMEK